ncbi:MAG: Na/Pi cotransporter family protein [Clostridia bacterium]|nr:Na/Pi cotransporter family protein [Clostridia bacterium]
MDIFSVLSLIGGLVMFLFGMNIMGEALERKAGNQLKSILSKLTSSPIKGFLLGAGVTAIIQSSSATTVMVVGFVNSGIMTLRQSVGVIMGANVGTTITSWILSLTAIEGSSLFLEFLKPSSFTPILALVGIIFYMFLKDSRKKDIGLILLGFSVLIFGMNMMSASVEPLSSDENFRNILLLFNNPILGVLTGALVTAIIQSSSASVGILQALSATGQVTLGSAIPIIMGQGIGTCITAMLSSIGANKNARCAALVHLYFNIIGTVVLLSLFYAFNAIFPSAAVISAMPADPFNIAVVNTAFKLFSTAILMPFSRQLEKLAIITVGKSKTSDPIAVLDERLLPIPSVAIEQCHDVTMKMAELSVSSLKKAIGLITDYNDKIAQQVVKDEKKVDSYEDTIGTYLVRINSTSMSEKDSLEATKLLHVISDFERISDHAVAIMKSAEEMHSKKLNFSDYAYSELAVMIAAVNEIIDMTMRCFIQGDLKAATCIEPLEEVIDHLQSELRRRHIERLKNNLCTIELGFILTDLLTSLERVSDHCSNIACCMVEIAHDGLSVHEYVHNVKDGHQEQYNRNFESYMQKYVLS